MTNSLEVPITPSALLLEGWRQFDRVDLKFHAKLTVLTGVNGSGKSTILAILAQHFDWQTQFAAVPRRDRKGTQRFFPDWRDPDDLAAPSEWIDGFYGEDADWRQGRPERPEVPGPGGNFRSVGSLSYSDGSATGLGVPSIQSEVYSLQPISGNFPNISGLFLSAFRNPAVYTKLQSIPAAFSAPDVTLNEYIQQTQSRYFSRYVAPDMSAFKIMKQSLVSAALYGPGNEFVDSNSEAKRVWEDFHEILKTLLPPELNFSHLVVRAPEILVKTTKGDEYPIDAVSGGVQAILEVAWQIYLRSWNKSAFTVLMDEPENHLHPSLQRSLLPNLISAFPQAQFIIATHSPHVVTAVPDSNVYVLRNNTDGLVYSTLLDGANKAESVESILRDVLGVETTLPNWAVERYENILRRYLSEVPSTDTLRRLRQELEESGLGGEFPEAVTAMTDEGLARQQGIVD